MRTHLLMVYDLCLLISLLFNVIETSSPFKKQSVITDYHWVTIEEWSSCSTTCGPGVQHKNTICVQTLLYSETVVSSEYCKSMPKPTQMAKNCNLGECENSYYWKTSKWSECSQTCGNSGRKSRDVDCVYDKGLGVLDISSADNCDIVLRPNASAPCNIFDCPPKFVPGKWENCIKSRGCLPGKQRRSLECIGILKNGKSKKMPRNACYKEGTPPLSWRKCYDHINNEECLKSNKQVPVIELKQNTLVQMRKTKTLKIQIGQVAYVLLYTRIIISCPVNYFVSREIIWKHKTNVYKFDGKKEDRIKVDKKGRLRITKVKPEDQGSWMCMAGPTNATAIIKSRNPSVGYQDWFLRTALWNRDMLNEDPQIGSVRQDVVQWITKSWSACSLSCGGDGIQTREVHCEEIDSRHYSILSDEICENRGQKKPDTKRTCNARSQCPKWQFKEYDTNQCSDKCLGIGVAQVQGKLSCIYQEKEIDINSCDKEKKPLIDCPNKNCQVKWKISQWSKCSVSCGGNGIMARYLMCVWNNTGQTAGSFCYKENLNVPKVIKACIAPRCNLKCVDLSSNCHKQGKFCKLSIYRYTCCKTCYHDYRQSRIQTTQMPVTKPKKLKRKIRKYRRVSKTVRNKKKGGKEI